MGKFTNIQTQNKLIQIQIYTKHDKIFKTLNIDKAQNTNIYTTSIHNNANVNDQKPTGTNSSS